MTTHRESGPCVTLPHRPTPGQSHSWVWSPVPGIWSMRSWRLLCTRQSASAGTFTKACKHASSDEPVRTYLHALITYGNNEFCVVDRETDQTKVVCTGIEKAVRFAKHRDEAPVAIQEQRPIKKPAAFAIWMLRWTCTLSFILGMFAFLGRTHDQQAKASQHPHSP